jgi:hypothetical protein
MAEDGKRSHGFSGNCAPGVTQFTYETLSVGVPKSSGKGLKKGPVKVRISGHTSDHESVYEKARQVVAQLDAGTYAGPKTIRVEK